MWQDIFQLNKSNKVQALYPSVKLYMAAAFLACSLILGTIKIAGYPFLLIPWFLLLVILAAVSGVFKKHSKILLGLSFLALLIFVIQAFLVPRGEIIWRAGFLKLSTGGLDYGLTISLNVLNMGGIVAWLFQTTENKEFSYAMTNAGFNPKAAYVFLSCFQMIDTLSSNLETIMNAQRARGVETEGNILVRAKAFVPSLIPLILGAVTGAEERALTLDAKGFDVQCKKTQLFEIERSPYDKIAVVITTVVLVAVTVGRIALWVL